MSPKTDNISHDKKMAVALTYAILFSNGISCSYLQDFLDSYVDDVKNKTIRKKCDAIDKMISEYFNFLHKRMNNKSAEFSVIDGLVVLHEELNVDLLKLELSIKRELDIHMLKNSHTKAKIRTTMLLLSTADTLIRDTMDYFYKHSIGHVNIASTFAPMRLRKLSNAVLQLCEMISSGDPYVNIETPDVTLAYRIISQKLTEWEFLSKILDKTLQRENLKIDENNNIAPLDTSRNCRM